MSKIGIGFVGTGFARTTQAPMFRTYEAAELVGVCSGSFDNATKMAEEFGIPHACRSIEELLAIDEISLVVISAPPVEHHRFAIAALEAGKHVICEKPMAMNAEQALEMTKAAEARSGQLSIIDHELRFNPTWRRMKELVDEGFLGEVYHVNVTITTGFRHAAQRPWNWWAQKSAGGGLLGALGSHAIDSLRWLFGEIDAVVGVVSTMVPTRVDSATGEMRAVETDDYCSFLVRFVPRRGRATLGSVTLSAVVASGGRNQIAIAGERGTIFLENDETLLAAGGLNLPLQDLSVPDPARELAGVPGSIWARSFYHLAGATLTALQEGRSAVDGAATFLDGWRCQQVIDAVHRSQQSRRWERAE
ncbi:MAG: Gfo/Idh/MocA family oxidoreductase [Acidobacteriota bacterium]